MLNKKRKNLRFFRCNFFPKNNRGQFFLIISVMIIGLVAGLAGVTNSIQKKSDVKFYYVGEELKLESGKVIDYGISQNLDATAMKNLLTGFSEDYSTYSNADNFYYIFGTTNGITFAGCRKKTNGQATIEDNSGTTLSTLTINQGPCDPITSTTLSPPPNIILKIDDVKFSFSLQQGQNFYFVVSKEIKGDVYTATNGN